MILRRRPPNYHMRAYADRRLIIQIRDGAHKKLTVFRRFQRCFVYLDQPVTHARTQQSATLALSARGSDGIFSALSHEKGLFLIRQLKNHICRRKNDFYIRAAETV